MKQIITLCCGLMIVMSLQAQKERDLSYKEVPLMRSAQWQALEMKEDEDIGLMIYDTDLGEFYRYNGDRWISLGDGGQVHATLSANKELLSLRQSYLDRIAKNTGAAPSPSSHDRADYERI